MLGAQKHRLPESGTRRDGALAVASCVAPSTDAQHKVGWSKQSTEHNEMKDWLVGGREPLMAKGTQVIVEPFIQAYREFFKPEARRRLPSFRYCDAIEIFSYREKTFEKAVGEAQISWLDPWREQLRRIGDLESDWDGEGASAPSPELISSAETMLDQWLREARNLRGKHFDIPRIGPVADGSIDIHWVTEDYELLVNIGGPGSDPDSGTYYGDNYADDRTEGTFRLDAKTPTPFLWLLYR